MFSVGRDRDEEGFNSFPYSRTGNAPKAGSSYFRLGLGFLPLSSSRVATSPKIFVMLAAITFWLGSLQVLDRLDPVHSRLSLRSSYNQTASIGEMFNPLLRPSPRKGNRLSHCFLSISSPDRGTKPTAQHN